MKPTYIQGDYTKSKFFDNTSRLVCGLSGLGGVWGHVAEPDAVDTILYALENGVRVLDTAPSYNMSQAYLGKALKEWSGEKPFISSKVGRLKAEKADDCVVDYSTETMRKSVYESLELIGVDSLDLLFLHEPHLVPVENMDQIMTCLNDLKSEGVVKRLGVGGNPTERFYPVLKKENFDVVSGFLKMDACNLSAFDKDIPTLKQEGMAYYAASALHMGLLGRRLDMYNEERPNNEWITNMDVDIALKMKEIADANEMSLPRLALRYMFSIEEADRVVVGPHTIAQMRDLLIAWREGALSETLFSQITETIVTMRTPSLV